MINYTQVVADGLPLVSALPVEHLFDMRVDLEPVQLIPTPVGTRMTFVTVGGVVDGPRLRGVLRPGGGDWVTVGADGIGRVDVRATIATHDGVLIHLAARGVIALPPDGLTRLANGEALPFTQTYVRTTPRFETSDERYGWLTAAAAVAYNALLPNRVDYRVYRLL